MSLAKRLVEHPQREIGGSLAQERFDYQALWGLALIFSNHETGEDYAIAFEFHDDVLLLDSAKAPASIRFHQVKIVLKDCNHWQRPRALVAVRPVCFRLPAGVRFMVPALGSALQMFLNRLTSRSILTDEEQSAILGLTGHIMKVAAHRDFVKLGEEVTHSCLVVDGLVGRFGQTRDGNRQITCLYIPGDMADLPSVVSPESAWGLCALAATTILRVPHIDLRRAAAKHAGIAEAFWRDCVADGSIFSEWVVNVGRRDAIARLAHLLCEMAIRCERAGLGDRHSFPLPASQAYLGDATGLTSVHVNRTLKTLREKSGVTMRAGMVVVHDWKAIESIGDFDDAYMLLDRLPVRILEAA